MPKRTVQNIDVAGKRALVRVDFNVPTDPSTGRITDDSRIRESLPTIQFLREKGATVILCCHIGRPKGRAVENLRTTTVRNRLAELLAEDVADLGDPISAPAAAGQLKAREVALLENIRFDPREETNDDSLAVELAALADLYVNDAFGAAHRAHASTAGVANHLPAVAGLLMARELDMLGAGLDSPRRPMVAVIGGAKVADKIAVLENLIGKTDSMLIGGGMIAAFAAALGHNPGAALPTREEVDQAGDLINNKLAGVTLPDDVVTAPKFAEDAAATVHRLDSVPGNELILDIGPVAGTQFAGRIAQARTVIWNGPMGVCEWGSFAAGTIAVATAVASNADATTIVGGGSTAGVVRELSLAENFTHISTGGGAALEFMEGKTLPGVDALMEI